MASNLSMEVFDAIIFLFLGSVKGKKASIPKVNLALTTLGITVDQPWLKPS